MVIGRITQQECNSFANVETPQRCHLSHGNGRIYRAAHQAADGVSQRKYNYMRAEQIYRDEQGLSLMPHTAQPVLPAQNQALPPEVRAFLNAGRTR